MSIIIKSGSSGFLADVTSANALKVDIGGSAIDTGVADKSSFTYGTSIQQPIGGIYQDTSPTLTSGQAAAVRLTSFRSFHVNLRDSSGNEKLGSSTSANSIPVVIASDQGAVAVSGTIAATQSGTWTNTVTQATAANLNATVVGSGNFTVVQATAANLNATVTGTVAATQSATWTVQPGNTANTTAWLVADSLSQGSTTSGQKGSLQLGAITTAAPAYTNGQSSPLSLTTAGLLRVDGSGVTQPVSGTGTFTVSGTVTANIGTSGSLALDASVTGLQVAQGSTTSGQKGGLTLGAVTTAAPAYTTAQSSPLSLTTTGLLRVDGSGATQPVSGTVTANAGTGSFTVAQATAANLNATVVGTVTANIGTSGSLALDASVTGLQVTQGSTTSGQKGGLVLGAVTTAAPAYTNGQSSAFSLTTTGALRTDSSATTQPVSGTITANIGTTNGLALDATLAKLTIAQGATLGANTQAMVAGSVTTAAPTYTTGQISPLSLSTAGALRVDNSAVTQPVSGTITANQGGTWTNTVTQATAANLNATVVGSGNFTVVQPTAANLNATVTGTVAATQSATWTVQPGNTANTTPWLTTISQGGNSAAVKAASTAAVATDPAIVVAISPNNSITVGPVTVSQSDTTATGTLNALNTTASVALAGTSNSAMQLLAGTLVGTIVPEVSVDGGTTWVAAYFDDPATGNKVSSIVFGANNTATARSIIGTGGSSNVRVRVSAFTSGTATCNLRASTQADESPLYEGAAGSALAPTVAQVGGSVTTAAPTYTTATMNALSLTTAGALRTDASGSTQPVSGTITANIGTSGSLALDASVTAIYLTDNAAFTDGTTKVTPAAYILDETAGTALTENDAAAARIDAKRAQVMVIEDATTRGTRMAVKAASTAAVATDPAMVVAISPNNTITVQPGNTANTTPWLATINQGGNSAVVKAASTAVAAADPAVAVSLSPNSHVKATVQPLYGTNNQAMTITLASLTNTSARASTAVDNSTNLFEDVLLFFKFQTAAAATSATGYINVYGYGTVDGGTTYPESITGTDAAITLTAPPNLTLLAQFNAVANSHSYLCGPVSFCRAYGLDRLPQRWGIVFVNQSGATLNATAGNFSVTYQGMNGQFV